MNENMNDVMMDGATQGADVAQTGIGGTIAKTVLKTGLKVCAVLGAGALGYKVAKWAKAKFAKKKVSRKPIQEKTEEQ